MTPAPSTLAEGQIVTRAVMGLGLGAARWPPLSKLPIADLLAFALGPSDSPSTPDPVVALLDAVARDLRLLRPTKRGARGYQRRADVRASITSAALRVEVAAELHRRTLVGLSDWIGRRDARVREEARKEAAETAAPDATGGAS